MEPIRLLILEDSPAAVRDLREALGALPGIQIDVETKPPAWKDRVAKRDFDILVTDLKADAEDTMAGDQAIDHAFRHRFTPIVVYSGVPDLDDHFETYRQHPFLRKVSKGGENPIQAVVGHVMDSIELANALRSIHDHVESAYQVALTTTALAFAKVDAEVAKALPYIVRRRIAASFDDPQDGGGIRSIERYLVPPIGKCLYTGDVLVDPAAAAEDATRFRLVLSQSCDLAWSAKPKRDPKTQRVLTAMSTSTKKLTDRITDLRKVPKATEPEREELKKLLGELAKGNLSAGLIALPKVPPMTQCGFRKVLPANSGNSCRLI